MQASGAQRDFGLVRQDRIGSVLVLVLAHPPVNTLTGPVQQALLAALDEAAADATISAVILRGEGRCFSAGADIREAGQVGRMAELARLCRRVEGFPRPVIAALHGTALGAGCELALAAHYRIANAAAILGLPEVGLGLLPGGGATQRLPRLIGAEQALRLLTSGLPLRAPDALAMGLVDRVVSENLGEAALAMALDALPIRPSSEVRAGLRDMVAHQAAVTAARLGNKGNPLPAPGRIIDCVEAAGVLPFEMGLAMEAVAFEDLAASSEAQGLRHAFLAERRALSPPVEVAGRPLPDLAAVAIWGAGEMAPDLAFQALNAGLRVTLCDRDRVRLAEALGRVAALQEQAVAQGRKTEDARDAEWARLSSGLGVEALAGADLVLLAEPGPMPAGLACAGLGAASGPGMAGVTVPAGPGDLAELSIGAGVAPVVLGHLVALGRRLGWRVVAVGPGGPVELGLRLALEAAEQHLVAQGHAAEAVQAALTAFGMGVLARGLPPMPKGGMALVQTCLAAMAAEGARMLADGRARRPCDIDAVALLSGLVPRWRGGPMFLADQRGLLVLRADLRKHAAPVFAVSAVLDGLIADGKRFADLDAV